MQAIMSTVASMDFPRRTVPEEFELSTHAEPPPPPGIDPMRQNDPWNRTRAQAAESTAVPRSPFNSQQQEEAQQPEPTQPAYRMPHQHAPAGQPIPPRPANWEDVPHSPFENSYASPQAARQNARHNAQGRNDEFMGNQKAVNRENKSMYMFSGHSADFKNWRNRFVDHMAMVHTAWRNALLWLGTTKTDPSYA